MTRRFTLQAAAAAVLGLSALGAQAQTEIQ